MLIGLNLKYDFFWGHFTRLSLQISISHVQH
jgi:hypothetical protein